MQTRLLQMVLDATSELVRGCWELSGIVVVGLLAHQHVPHRHPSFPVCACLQACKSKVFLTNLFRCRSWFSAPVPCTQQDLLCSKAAARAEPPCLTVFQPHPSCPFVQDLLRELGTNEVARARLLPSMMRLFGRQLLWGPVSNFFALLVEGQGEHRCLTCRVVAAPHLSTIS